MTTLLQVPDQVIEQTQEIDRSQVAIIVPTCDALAHWERFEAGLAAQGFDPMQVLIIDSGSEDGTADRALDSGFQVIRIQRSDFNHGGTRQLALEYVSWAKIVVYLTQDAVLADPDSIDRLIAVFEDPQIAAAYGRQLPRPEAGPVEAHARLFNYPEVGDIRDFASQDTLGIRAVFMSNSFAAYRADALREVGGFPCNVILSEDAITAAKLLLTGWKTAYVAEAHVFHSHEFTIAQEFRRYFDIGVVHSRERWLCETFGRANGEGQRFIRSEMRYLLQHGPGLIPSVILRNLAKWIGYELGLREQGLGPQWCRRLSYHPSFWITPRRFTNHPKQIRPAPSLPQSQITP